MSWTSNRLVRFIKLTEGRVFSYPLKINGMEYRVKRVLNYDPFQSQNLEINKNIITFPCSQGFVQAEILPD